jgi:AbrB family looped-hinge helix DNA binding protein
MDLTFATVSSKGQLVIPKEMRETLGIEAGTRIAISVEAGRIVLQPSNMKLVDKLCGIAAGGPSMTDQLLAERRAEHRRSEQRMEQWLASSAAAK